MSDPKKHHYVPQWILRNFSFDEKKKKICVADKIEGGTRCGAILDYGMQNHFYKYKESGESLEVAFVRDIDEAGSVAFSNAQKNSVERLQDCDRFHLRRFFAAQILRVPAILGSLQRFDADLQRELGEDFTIINKSAHSDFLDSLVRDINSIEQALQSKRMEIFIESSDEHRFLIGDSPVFRVDGSQKVRALYGGGLPVIDSDFMAMPLSPMAILVFYKEEAGMDLLGLISKNNSWQFINAERFIFSNTEVHLKQCFKGYYEVNYRYIELLDPGVLERMGIRYGDRVDVGPMRIAFSDKVKQELTENFIINPKKPRD